MYKDKCELGQTPGHGADCCDGANMRCKEPAPGICILAKENTRLIIATLEKSEVLLGVLAGTGQKTEEIATPNDLMSELATQNKMLERLVCGLEAALGVLI